MNWIAVDCEIAEDPKTRAVCRLAAVPTNEGVGAVVRVFGKMRHKAKRGSLALFDSETINAWAGYHDAHPFAAAFVAQFCDGKRKVISWMRYNGKMIAKGEKDVVRMRNYRKKKDLERQHGSANRSRTGTRTVHEPSRVPNPTQPNLQKVGGLGELGGERESREPAPLPHAVPSVSAVAGVSESSNGTHNDRHPDKPTRLTLADLPKPRIVA